MSDLPGVTRRRLLQSAAGASAAAMAFGNSTGPAKAEDVRPAEPNLIEVENRREGALDWQLTRVRLDAPGAYRTSLIEGYCSHQSVATGDTLQIMVSTVPAAKFKCRAMISVGHDEYWDIRQWHSVVAMRDAGVNLLFLSGNSVCWVSPLKPSRDGRPHRITFRGGPYGGTYKYAEDRHAQHGPFPERGPDEGYLMGARNVDPVNGGGDWVITKPAHWMFEGTGVKHGERIPGLVGWEYHGDPPHDVPGLEVVARGTAFQGGTRPQQWTATIYPGPHNNYVFNASTIFWDQDLSSPPGHWLPWSHWSRPHGPDPRVQRITHNLLRRAIGT